MWPDVKVGDTHTHLMLVMLPVSEPSLHLSSWLATICRSASSSLVRRSNCSSWGCTKTQRSRLSSHLSHLPMQHIFLMDKCCSFQPNASAGFTWALERMYYVLTNDKKAVLWFNNCGVFFAKTDHWQEVSPSNVRYVILIDVTFIDIWSKYRTKQNKLAFPRRLCNYP